MSDMDALVELAARAIDDAVRPWVGRDSSFVDHRDAIATATLLAVGLPALLERVEAAEGALIGSRATRNLREKLAGQVRQRLTDAGMTQADLASFAGLSQKHLSQILNGRQDGSLSMWQRLLDFVNVEPLTDHESLAAKVATLADEHEAVAARCDALAEAEADDTTALDQYRADAVYERQIATDLRAALHGRDIEINALGGEVEEWQGLAGQAREDRDQFEQQRDALAAKVADAWDEGRSAEKAVESIAELIEVYDKRRDRLTPLWSLLAEWESWQENPDRDDDVESMVTTVVTGLRYALNKATLGLPAPDIDHRLSTYLNARGLELPEVTTADHVVEEATEFREAWQSGDRESTVHELADVVLSVAVAARQMGTTVEACIESKTEYDRGRENA